MTHRIHLAAVRDELQTCAWVRAMIRQGVMPAFQVLPALLATCAAVSESC